MEMNAAQAASRLQVPRVTGSRTGSASRLASNFSNTSRDDNQAFENHWSNMLKLRSREEEILENISSELKVKFEACRVQTNVNLTAKKSVDNIMRWIQQLREGIKEKNSLKDQYNQIVG